MFDTATSPETVRLLEWNVAVRVMSRADSDEETRRAASVLVLKLAAPSYAQLVRDHDAAGWPPPPPEAIYQAVLAEARERLTWGRATVQETAH